MLFTVINKNPILTKTRLNILKMYVTLTLTHAIAVWALFLTCSQWRTLEATQTIGIRLVMDMSRYVKNEILLKSFYYTSLKHAKPIFYKNTLSEHRQL